MALKNDIIKEEGQNEHELCACTCDTKVRPELFYGDQPVQKLQAVSPAECRYEIEVGETALKRGEAALALPAFLRARVIANEILTLAHSGLFDAHCALRAFHQVYDGLEASYEQMMCWAECADICEARFLHLCVMAMRAGQAQTMRVLVLQSLPDSLQAYHRHLERLGASGAKLMAARDMMMHCQAQASSFRDHSAC